MRLKNRNTALLVAAFTIGIFFIATPANPYGVNQQSAYPPAYSHQRAAGPQAGLRTLAPMAKLDLSSSEFTARSARLAESREARPQKERGNWESLILIGFGFMLFGSVVLIRRGSAA